MDSVEPSLLIVEDDPTSQKVLGLLAEKFGFSYVVAGTCKEVLDLLERSESGFDTILMDIRMPDMNGYECTKRIRDIEKRTGRSIPIVAVTALASEEYKKQCLAVGMDDYLSKPFEQEEFRKVLLKWAYNPKFPNLKLLAPPKVG